MSPNPPVHDMPTSSERSSNPPEPESAPWTIQIEDPPPPPLRWSNRHIKCTRFPKFGHSKYSWWFSSFIAIIHHLSEHESYKSYIRSSFAKCYEWGTHSSSSDSYMRFSCSSSWETYDRLLLGVKDKKIWWVCWAVQGHTFSKSVFPTVRFWLWEYLFPSGQDDDSPYYDFSSINLTVEYLSNGCRECIIEWWPPWEG